MKTTVPRPTKKFWQGISVISEIIEQHAFAEVKGIVLYDASCGMCTRHARRVGPTLRRRGFFLVPMQTPWLRERLEIDPDVYMTRMWAFTVEGALYGGADAVVFLAGRLWWGRPFAALARVPGMMRAIDASYRWIAANRYRLGGTCEVEKGVQT